MIRAFAVEFPGGALEDLRRRLAATRWPERETVADDSQGVPPATIQELARVLGEQAGFFEAKNIAIPFAISAFPDELYQAPRSWAERAYPDNLIYYNRLEAGGHFAAWEQPQLFCEEMRSGFRSLS